MSQCILVLGQVIEIDVLPDDVLLEIFDFYVDTMNSTYSHKWSIEEWQSLVHVCRRWRALAFESPRRLNLQLYCTPKTPARDTLDVWPALPLIVWGNMTSLSSTDNVIATLGQSNRVSYVHLLDLAGWQLEEIMAAMQVPFPELTGVQLSSNGETAPVIPDSFIDGSAPRLRKFRLEGIPFTGLPRLLSSAIHLVALELIDIPHSGYISPEGIVTLFAVLPSLERLVLLFQSHQSRPDWGIRRPPPSKRSVIPALTYLSFKGVVEYLEDLVTGIDAPQLYLMYISFFNQIDFDTPQLAQFINRTPKLRTRDEAYVLFKDTLPNVMLQPRPLDITISCREPDWQLSSIVQVCNSLHPISTVEVLSVENRYWKLDWKNDAIENTLWLQLLLPFTAVKDLYLSKEFSLGVAAALEELVGRRITEVLPSLQNIFVKELKPSGPFQEKIGQFIAARQLSDHPIAISVWDKNSKVKPI